MDIEKIEEVRVSLLVPIEDDYCIVISYLNAQQEECRIEMTKKAAIHLRSRLNKLIHENGNANLAAY